MDEARVFKLTRRLICSFCNQRIDRDAQVEALVMAARAISENAWQDDPWVMGPWQVRNEEMVALETALFELGKHNSQREVVKWAATN